MTSIGSPFMWLLFALVVVVALFVDFTAMSKQGPHKVSMREAALWSLAWVAASFLFAGWLWWYLGTTGSDAGAELIAREKTLEFLTGYGIEKALAVDNVFVFLMIFTYFGVPPEFQKRVLMIGILGALVLRAILIFLGAWIISEFHWVLYIFGAFLVYTGVRMWYADTKEPDFEGNATLKWLRQRMNISKEFDGEKFLTIENGQRVLTPLALVILLIGVVDVLFAVDSIPAIFAITTDPFIVLTSNVFAVLGLRALYFLVVNMHERFHLLTYGLAFLLVFIGIKLLIMDIYAIPIGISLLATFSILLFAVVLSIFVPPRDTADNSAPARPEMKD